MISKKGVTHQERPPGEKRKRQSRGHRGSGSGSSFNPAVYCSDFLSCSPGSKRLLDLPKPIWGQAADGAAEKELNLAEGAFLAEPLAMPWAAVGGSELRISQEV